MASERSINQHFYMSREGLSSQQFSLNSFLGDKDGDSEGPRVQKAMLRGFLALELRRQVGCEG
jgi:hypothetical protein